MTIEELAALATKDPESFNAGFDAFREHGMDWCWATARDLTGKPSGAAGVLMAQMVSQAGRGKQA